MKHSYSDLQTASRCLAKYYYRVNLNLEPRRAAEYFDVGTYVHKLLLAYYTGSVDDTLQALKDQIAADGELFSDQRDEQLRLLDEALKIVLRYALKYIEDTGWTVLHAEESFEYALGSGEMLTYTPDLVVRDTDGNVWVVDHKTTSDGVPRELPVADLQVLLYLSGIKEKYPECQGLIFNYLRKKNPTMPRLNKTGEPRVNNLNNIDTTYGVLRAFLEAEAPDLLDDPGHAARLEELNEYDRFFFRQVVRVDDATLKRALDDARGLIAIVRTQTYPRSFVSFGPTACQTCPYKDLCMGELLGYDTARIIREQYKTREKK